MTDEQLATVDLAQVSLRADPGNLPFQPPDPNTAATWNERAVLWLGPDEWLVVGEASSEGSIERELQDALAGHDQSVVDVSANRIVIELTGGPALLASGCGLDLDPNRWLPGMCTQTLFGGAQVILHQLDERTTRVFVRPSFADYVTGLLAVTRP